MRIFLFHNTSFYSQSTPNKFSEFCHQAHITRLVEYNEQTEKQKNGLKYSFESAMKRFDSPRSEFKRRSHYAVKPFYPPSPPVEPYFSFEKDLSPSERFEKKWLFRTGQITRTDIENMKRTIDFNERRKHRSVYAVSQRKNDIHEEEEEEGNDEFSDDENQSQKNDSNSPKNKKKSPSSPQNKNKSPSPSQNKNRSPSPLQNKSPSSPKDQNRSDELKIEDLDESDNDLTTINKSNNKTDKYSLLSTPTKNLSNSLYSSISPKKNRSNKNVDDNLNEDNTNDQDKNEEEDIKEDKDKSKSKPTSPKTNYNRFSTRNYGYQSRFGSTFK